MFLAQAVRQDFGNWHGVMLPAGACHAVLILGDGMHRLPGKC